MLLQLVENGTSITDSTAATDTSSSTTLDAMSLLFKGVVLL